MEARERENAARRARGGAPLPMPEGWVTRPRLNDAERMLFGEFLQLAQFCGGDPRPADLLAWCELRDIAPSERHWVATVFGAMAGVCRERRQENSGD